MRKVTVILAMLAAATAALADGPPRPRITGISHVAVFTTQREAANAFYGNLLGLSKGNWEGAYRIGAQTIELEAHTASSGSDLLAHVAFATDDAEGMRRFLAAHGIAVPDSVHTETNGTRWFTLKDPEGHPIEFVQEETAKDADSKEISHSLIHAGFVVHDRALEDKFYRDLLGFRLYWQGGMKDTQTDWIDMQVPDGTQWLEYMMQPAGAKPDARLLGILNHFALGVPDVKAAAQRLQVRGWKPSDNEHPQIGRDGKWQLNLYDPDGTRVELMEFVPVEQPCCSKYLGPHPH